MKKRIKLITARIILLVIIILILLYVYSNLQNPKAKPTKEIQETCEIETNEYMGRPIYVIKPKNTEAISEKVILYFHGGAYMENMTSNHWKFIKKLVEDTNMRVIIPDYPLTPKYNYENVMSYSESVYTEVIKKVDVNNLIMMGDSAGGGLAIALEELLSNDGIDIPNKTIVISPWLDVSMSNTEMDKIAEYDKDLNKEKLVLAGLLYAENTETTNYQVSPIYGDLSKLKNITMFTGTYDILNPDVHLFKEKASKVNVNVEIMEYEQATHIWMINKNCDETIVNQGYSDLLISIKEK